MSGGEKRLHKVMRTAYKACMETRPALTTNAVLIVIHAALDAEWPSQYSVTGSVDGEDLRVTVWAQATGEWVFSTQYPRTGWSIPNPPPSDMAGTL